MIRLGYCGGFDSVDTVAAAGFEFLEANFTTLARMEAGEYEALQARVKGFPIPVEAANCLVPADLPITGPAADLAALEAYLRQGFARAAGVGIRLVVFGSGGARKVPDGFPMDTAWQQMAAFLRMAAPIAAENGVEIVLEPLRRRETNILNYVSEGVIAASLAGAGNVYVLGDTFHMDMSAEPLSALTLAGDLLHHVHVSETLDDERGRIVPTAACKDAVDALFAVLKAMGYTGRVSVEAGAKDLAAEAPVAFGLLDAARRA